jgi:mannose-6-phosphate isomerase-like protein (cupin superfamily)
MEIFNKSNSRNTGTLEILTSHILISPQNSSSKNLSIQISTIPIGSEQPIHAHEPEQCYYIVKGTGLMIIEGEAKEVKSGDAIYIAPNKKHGIRNLGGMDLEYLTANTPAFTKEYEKSFWPSDPIITRP